LAGSIPRHITNPNIAYILMLIGIYGVLFEPAAMPGTILPGVIGATYLQIGLFALNLLPISYAGIGLVMLGVVLLVAEAFAPLVVPGAGGIAGLVIGLLLMFDSGCLLQAVLAGCRDGDNCDHGTPADRVGRRHPHIGTGLCRRSLAAQGRLDASKSTNTVVVY
jgi:hypothetical protein